MQNSFFSDQKQIKEINEDIKTKKKKEGAVSLPKNKAIAVSCT